jgi:hypothetical protein
MSVQEHAYIARQHHSNAQDRQSQEYCRECQLQRSSESLVQCLSGVAPRELDLRVVNVQELAQRLPSVLNIVLQQPVLRHERAYMLIMPFIPHFGIFGEVAIEQNLPAPLERRPGPLAMHAEELCDRDQAFG